MSIKKKNGPLITMKVENGNTYTIQWCGENNNFGYICRCGDGSTITGNINETTLIKLLKGEISSL